jgi:hypothetical protein
MAGGTASWLEVNKQVKWCPSKTTADSNKKMAKSLTYKSRKQMNETYSRLINHHK